MLYSALAVLVVFVVGILVSCISNLLGVKNERLNNKYYALRLLGFGSNDAEKVENLDNLVVNVLITFILFLNNFLIYILIKVF